MTSQTALTIILLLSTSCVSVVIGGEEGFGDVGEPAGTSSTQGGDDLGDGDIEPAEDDDGTPIGDGDGDSGDGDGEPMLPDLGPMGDGDGDGVNESIIGSCCDCALIAPPFACPQSTEADCDGTSTVWCVPIDGYPADCIAECGI
jgi:hypothetical protein